MKINVHEMKLKQIYFKLIKREEKSFEVRLNDEKRKMISIGDTIIFKMQENQTQTISTTVKNLIRFNSFFELINALPVEKLGFKNKDKKFINDIYHDIYSYEDEKKYGVLAIELKINK